MMEARMDGTAEQQLRWRVSALREALSEITTMDGVARQIARNALGVDDHNAETMKKSRPSLLTEAQTKHMVDRFLGWRLPEHFTPDAGISFKATFNEHTAHPMKHEPIGTNLFDFGQAREMVRYMIEGMPDA